MSPCCFETIWHAEQRVRDGECMFSAEAEQKESVLVRVRLDSIDPSVCRRIDFLTGSQIARDLHTDTRQHGDVDESTRIDRIVLSIADSSYRKSNRETCPLA